MSAALRRISPSNFVQRRSLHSILTVSGSVGQGSSNRPHTAVARAAPEDMEIEIKLRLANKESHDKLVSLLASDQRNVFRQENFFFDGAKQELTAQRCVLRCRFYNTDEKAIVTLKGKMVVQDGIGRATEEESAVEPSLGRSFLAEPSKLLEADLDVIKKLRKQVTVDGLVCLGGFDNIRKEVDWRDEVLEIDETQYEWGTVYEIECETANPEQVRQELEVFLKDNGIEYKHNTTTKFANFIKRSLE